MTRFVIGAKAGIQGGSRERFASSVEGYLYSIIETLSAGISAMNCPGSAR
jgi:hypothetical protein